MKQKFYQLTVSKAHEKTATVAGVRDRARRGRDGSRGKRETAAKNNRRSTEAPLGVLEKALPKSTAEKVNGACVTLLRFIVKLSTGRRPRASTTPQPPLLPPY